MFRSIMFQDRDLLIVSERATFSHFAILVTLLITGTVLFVGATRGYAAGELRIAVVSYLLFAGLYWAMRTVDRRAIIQKAAAPIRARGFSGISLALIIANILMLAALVLVALPRLLG